MTIRPSTAFIAALSLLAVAHSSSCSGRPAVADAGAGGGGRDLTMSAAGVAGGSSTAPMGGGVASCGGTTRDCPALFSPFSLTLNGARFSAGTITDTVTVSSVTDGGQPRLELVGDAGVWRVELGPQTLPPTLVSTGETLTLRAEVTTGTAFVGDLRQRVTLTRGASVLLFGALDRSPRFEPPDLTEFGLDVRAGDVACTCRFLFCDYDSVFAEVRVDGGVIFASSAQTVAAGAFDVTVRGFSRSIPNGACDFPNDTFFFGVRR